MKTRNWFLGLAILGLCVGVASAADNNSLEERVNELKEKISRTKARIIQMQESIATDDASKTPAPAAAAGAPSLGTGGRAVVKHVNQIGSDVFKLIAVEYHVDAQPVFQKADPGELAAAQEIEVFNNDIGPGSHNLTVQMVYQGQPVWIFSYVEGYKFKVSSSYNFAAEQGKTVNLRVVGFDKGGWLTKLEDRPSIKYEVDGEAAASASPAG